MSPIPVGILGANNLIAFHTEVYRTTPLVLQGRGAWHGRRRPGRAPALVCQVLC